MHVQPPWLAPDEARQLVKVIERKWPADAREAEVDGPSEAVFGDDPRGRTRSKRPAFDPRLKLGNRYEFQLRDGTSVVGVLRRPDYPQGLGGENVDGDHPVQVTEGAIERFLNPTEIVGVRRCVGEVA